MTSSTCSIGFSFNVQHKTRYENSRIVDEKRFVNKKTVPGICREFCSEFVKIFKRVSIAVYKKDKNVMLACARAVNVFINAI